MSLKSFLQKLWNQIKNLFSNLPVDIKTAIQLGVVITENIKSFVDSPIADLITNIIPGNIDDAIKDRLRKSLPELLMQLKLVESTANLTDPDTIVKTALATIQSLDSAIKPGLLHQLSVMIAQVAADGKLTWNDGVLLSQWYYEQEFKTSTGVDQFKN